jgi:hypothetical protein
MPDFTVRADHIDVEEIMRQIRARVRDKRGVDYTEQEIRELASVKLDRFLDPRVVRSDLLGHFKRQHQPAPLFLEKEEWPSLYAFDGELVYESSRGVVGRLLRLVRRLLNPVMKLFINPGPVLHVLHLQGPINVKHRELFERISQRLQTRDELDALNFEMFNNLVVEATRLGIEVKNLRMQVESLSTRLDFDERRARALEGVVQYKPGSPIAPPPPPPSEEAEEEAPAATDAAGEGRGPRRRRRRRGRRRGPGGPGESGPGEGGATEGGAAAAGAATADSEQSDQDEEGDADGEVAELGAIESAGFEADSVAAAEPPPAEPPTAQLTAAEPADAEPADPEPPAAAEPEAGELAAGPVDAPAIEEAAAVEPAVDVERWAQLPEPAAAPDETPAPRLDEPSPPEPTPANSKEDPSPS